MDAEAERSLADCRRVIDFTCVANRVGRGRSVGRTDRQSGVVPFWPLCRRVKKAIKVDDGGSDV